jgi:hypothetical protein
MLKAVSQELWDDYDFIRDGMPIDSSNDDLTLGDVVGPWLLLSRRRMVNHASSCFTFGISSVLGAVEHPTTNDVVGSL